MNSDGLPNRELLLEWMSAFLDGELAPAEEALLEQAMDADPELLRAFEELSSFALPEAASLRPAESDDLTRSVLAACAPDALDDSAESAARLTSLYLDDALDPGGQDRLFALLEGPLRASDDVRRFAEISEAVGATLHALPETPAVARATEPLPARIEAALAEEERLGLLWSAALDGELAPEEQAELELLLTESRAEDALSFSYLAEASALALRAPIQHPDAARAGAAALQAIAAYAAQAAVESAPRPAPEPKAGFSLPRLLARLFPVAVAATAAFAFAVLQRAPTDADPVTPPADWVAAFQGDDGVDPLDLLDNNAAEVQALDSGSHMAAVFATEESQITIIWVAEPDAQPDSETGT